MTSSDIDLELDPSESYIAPPRRFRGADLASYGLGAKMLLSGIARPGDSYPLFLYTLLYVLSHPREKIQRESVDKDAIRLNVLTWLDGFTSDDETAGQALAEKILIEANKGKVDAVATAGGESGNAPAPAVPLG